MSKPFKLRISRVITSFHSCRSKDPSTLPQEPVPSFLRLSPANQNFPAVDPPATPKPAHHHRSSFKRHVSSAFNSVGCGFGFKSDSDPEVQWQKEEKWHVVAMVHDDHTPRRKIYNSSVSGESDDNKSSLARPPPPEKKKRRSKKKRTTPRLRTSTSSADSGLFSSEGGDEREVDEESETLMSYSSSRSFSTDSSTEFNPQLKPIIETPISRPQKKKITKKSKRSKRHVKSDYKVKMLCRSSGCSPEGSSPARLSVFKKLIPCTVDGKVRESYAVVKKSEDPFEDFKRSMMEMVLEKQIFEERELEQLLQCFLSLNSRQHHGVIVEAFAEIWEAMFCRNSSSRRRHQRVVSLS
ncbi:transcription repressor OFP7-like [Cornus florida]|uniref:transcription repressor OFP7-like n=1 Tax=Cornus florida TaxID=4283 RepID=UPI00289BC6F4|nr:transcription repressor OFP7-like [Cornus florida]